MYAFLLYLACASLALFLARRVVTFSNAAFAVLLLLPLLPTGRALVTDRVFAPIDLAYAYQPLASIAIGHGVTSVANPIISDVYAEFVPAYEAVRRALAAGEWPLWNPFDLCGTVLAAAVQSALYHPVHLAALLLPLPQAVTFLASMLFLTAAVSTFLLLRDLECSEEAALFGGAAWMLSSHLIGFAGTALGMSLAVAPLVLLGARRVVISPGIRSVSLLTAALTLLMLSGHPESMLHVVALGVAYGLFLIAAERPRLPGRVLISAAAAGVVSLALCAISLVPFVDAMTQSEEYIHRAIGREHQKERAPLSRIAHQTLVTVLPLIDGRPGVAVLQHGPTIHHHWIGSAYAGALLFPLAVAALMIGRGSSRWFFLGAGLFGLLAGVNAPGAIDVLARLPFFVIAVNVRMIGFTALALAILAAMAVDAARGRPRATALTCAVVGLILLGSILLHYGVLTRGGLSPEWIRVEAFRAVAPLLLGALALLLLTPARIPSVLVLLLLLQRAGETAGIRPAIPRQAFYPPFPGLSLLRAAEPFRIVGEGDILVPNTATHYGLEDVRGFEALTFARIHETYPLWCIKRPVWSNRVDDLTSPFLSMMNVRYALAKPRPDPPAGWKRLAAFGEYDVLENTSVLGRAFVPRSVHTGWRDAMPAMQGQQDFRERAWIADGGREILPNGPGSVSARRTGSTLHLHASMRNEGWVVVSQSAWRGWRARLEGGRELPLTIANHAFLGIRVPAGEHDITLQYRPRSFIIGASISAVTILLLVGCKRWIGTRSRRYGRRAQAAPTQA